MKDKFIEMSNDEYHSHDALGSSDVRKIMISPLHFEGREEPAKRPNYFTFGSAAHCAYLEPEKFVERYRRKPLEVDGKGPRTNYYKEWIEEQKGVEWLSPDDFDKVVEVVASAHSRSISSEMFRSPHVVEGSLFFKMRGVECKARPDLVSFAGEDKVDVLDLKTTIDASPDGFRRKAVGQNKLFVQEWFYRKALEEAGLEVRRFIFLAVEKQAPFAAASYTLDQEQVGEAEEMVANALDAFKSSKESGVFEGYPDKVVELSVPQWCMPRKLLAMNGNWLTVKQAITAFSVSRATLYNWMARGLESRRIGGKRFISASSLVNLQSK